MKLSRQQLTEIIETDGGINWWKPRLFVEKIQPLLPPELDIIALPPDESLNYNCFVFAFGLEKETIFLGGSNPVQKEFVRHVLSLGVLSQLNEPKIGDLVFYENAENIITHAGIIQKDNLVLSKWMWGPIIQHDLLDVPASFGNKVFYTNRPTVAEIKDMYEKYKSSGVVIQPIL